MTQRSELSVLSKQLQQALSNKELAEQRLAYVRQQCDVLSAALDDSRRECNHLSKKLKQRNFECTELKKLVVSYFGARSYV